MQVVAWLRVERRYVAGGTLRRAVEQRLAAFESSAVVGSRRRLGSGNRELVEVQRGELGRQLVWRTARVARVALGGDGELILVVEARVEECSRAVHLGRSDIGVPVWDRSEAGPRVEIHAGESECRRYERASLLAVRAKR